MREVYDYLKEQDSLMQYLPGGFHFSGDIPYVSRQYIPDSFEEGKLIACGLFQTNTSIPASTDLVYSIDQNFSIFLYSVVNSLEIDPPRLELYDLLHYREIPTINYSWQAEFISETEAFWDDHLSAWGHVCRYRWLTNRR